MAHVGGGKREREGEVSGRVKCPGEHVHGEMSRPSQGRDNGKNIGTTGRDENITASAMHSLQKLNYFNSLKKKQEDNLVLSEL